MYCFNHIQRKLKMFITALFSMVILLKIMPTYVYAETSYYMAIAPNFQRYQYNSVVMKDSAFLDKDMAENLAGDVLSFRAANVAIPTTVSDKTWSKLVVAEANLAFSFPAIHNGNVTVGAYDSEGNKIELKGHGWFDTPQASGLDQNAATRVSQILTTNVNEMLGFIRGIVLKNNPIYPTSESDFLLLTSKLGTELYNYEKGYDIKKGSGASKTFNYGGYDFVISDVANIFRTTDKKRYYVTITAKDSSGSIIEERIFQYKVMKYDETNNELRWRAGRINEVHLGDYIFHGNSVYAIRGIEATGIGNVAEPGLLDGAIIDLFDAITSGLRSMLGLSTLPDLIFNQGTRMSSTWMGIAPKSWFDAASVLFWVSEFLAFVMLFFGLIKLFGDRNLATITPQVRVDLIQGSKDLLLAGLGLTLFFPIFQVVAKFNYLIVDIFANLSIYNSQIDMGMASGQTLGGAIVGLVYLGAELYFNYFYVLRGVTIALLYGVAPLFIACYGMGGRFKPITERFIKEIFGNIFVQMFHAIVLTFFGMYFVIGNSGGFLEQLVVMYSFIPLTKLFKSLTGIGESDFISSLAESTKNSSVAAATAIGGTAATGAVKGASKVVGGAAGKVLNKFQNKGGKGDGGDTNTLVGHNHLYDDNKTATSKQSVNANFNDSKTSPNNTTRMQNAERRAKNMKIGKNIIKGAGKLAWGAAKGTVGAYATAAGALTGNTRLTQMGTKVLGSGAEDLSGMTAQGITKGGKFLYQHARDYLVGNGEKFDARNEDPCYLGSTGVRDGIREDVMDFNENDNIKGIAYDGENFIMSYKNLDSETLEMLDMMKDQNNKEAQNLMKKLGINKVSFNESTQSHAIFYDAKTKGIHNVRQSGKKFFISKDKHQDVSCNYIPEINQAYHQYKQKMEEREAAKKDNSKNKK